MNLSFTINKKKNIINTIAIALIMVSFAFNFCMPRVFAIDEGEVLDIVGEVIKGSYKSILNPGGALIDTIGNIKQVTDDSYTPNYFQTEMVQDILGGINEEITHALDPNNAVYALAVGTYDDKGKWSSGGIVPPGLFTSFKAIAGLWCLGVALGRLIQNIDRGIDPFEAIFKTLVEICIVCYFIMYLERVVGLLCQIGAQIVLMVKDGIGDGALIGGEVTEKEAEAFLKKITNHETGTLGWRVETSMMLFFPWICSKAITVAGQLAVYQILIEIGIRRMFTPLAIGDIYQEGLRSPGVRYLKKILAAFLKLAVCVMVAGFAGKLSASVMVGETGISYAFGIIAVNLTCIMAMFKAGEYTNDIVGV